MPASQGCCHKRVTMPTEWGVSPLFSPHVSITLNTMAGLHVVPIENPALSPVCLTRRVSTLPESPPAFPFVLRI